jgi:Ca-activated chloride channel family protein
MQRWHLTAALGAVAGVAALVAPDLRASTTPQQPLIPDTPMIPAEIDPPQLVAVDLDSNLTMTAGLDHPAVLAGASQERLLVITVRGNEGVGEVDRPVNVAVVLDRSGSMAGKGKMEYAKQAARELIEGLDSDDTFSFVTFSDRANLVLPSQRVGDGQALIRAIEGVYEGGGTNLYAGLEQGISQVRSAASDEAVNRVVVLSDGKANVGVTQSGSIAELATRYADQGVRVSTIGLGLDYNEDLLAEMADRGGGSYHFVSDPDVLTQVFRDELHQMSSVAGSGVSLDVDLPGAELVEVYGYDEQRIDEGFRVWLGDVYGGQTRRIVARVRIKGTSEGDLLRAGRVELSESGQRTLDPIEVQASVTGNQRTIEKTVNRELAILGNEAAAGELVQQAAQAYSSGDSRKSDELLRASSLVAGEAASRYASDRLQQRKKQAEEQNVQYQTYDFESDEGRYNIKATKEQSRDWVY